MIITSAEAENYQKEFQDLLLKHNAIVPGSMEKYKTKKTSSTRKGKKEFETELLNLPPVLASDSIIYPGGKEYYNRMERFKGVDIPWASYCYTMLDQEHLADLVNLAKTLKLTINKGNTKADVCLLLTDYYNSKFAEDMAKVPNSLTGLSSNRNSTK